MTVRFGDCRNVMRSLIAKGEKVQMCVTSPPYYGLRDYNVDGQIGLEATLQEYVGTMVDVFALVWDLLEDDGTLWLNLGDTYAGSWGAQGKQGNSDALSGRRVVNARQIAGYARKDRQTGKTPHPGLKPKDLMCVPWRVAMALQACGWYFRQPIIWHKPNPMPESVTDRCTRAHEYLLLFAKAERYYFDHEAITEPANYPDGPRNKGTNKYSDIPGFRGAVNANVTDGLDKIGPRETRQKRSVWTVPTQPYHGSHFATFPPALIEPCILAGSRPGDTVLDPFFGSGTTGQVCNQLGRKYIGIELNPEYEPLQKERCAQQGLVL